MKLVHAAASLAWTGIGWSSRAAVVGGRVLIMGSVVVVRSVRPHSLSPLAGASARRPDLARPMAGSLSRSFGGYAEARLSLGWSRGHRPALPLARAAAC